MAIFLNRITTKNYRALAVTGKGEERSLPLFLRSLTDSGRCTFKVVRRISQLSPIRSKKRRLEMVGTGKSIPDRDAEAIGVPARRWLNSDDTLLLAGAHAGRETGSQRSRMSVLPRRYW
jgi:hypothetical protein